MNDKTDITLTINSRDYPIRVEPRKTLVDAIRDDCGSRPSTTITACNAATARPAS